MVQKNSTDSRFCTTVQRAVQPLRRIAYLPTRTPMGLVRAGAARSSPKGVPLAGAR